jgi:hypothetical protein
VITKIQYCNQSIPISIKAESKADGKADGKEKVEEPE